MRRRTVVYVDGFNFYYRSLKGTDYKWLDLNKFFEKTLGSGYDIQQIKYFTARLKEREDDPSLPQRQQVYLDALEKFVPVIKIYYGSFSINIARLPESGRVAGASKRKIVSVIKVEEKGSDVNLAVHLLNDAWHDAYDCAVLVSNDRDFIGAMRVVRQEFPTKIIMLVTQRKYPSKELLKCANFHRFVEKKFLKSSQLPNPIPGTNLHSPWLPRPPTP